MPGPGSVVGDAAPVDAEVLPGLPGPGRAKVGPAVPEAQKREVARRIRSRGLPGDARAADVIEASLG